MEIRSIGVAGAGVIGMGVAEDLAAAGIDVTLVDTTPAILDRARRQIEQNVRLHGFFKRPRPQPPAREILARIRWSTDPSLFREVDFVIENVTERWAIKERLYRELDAVCPDHVMFAANSSVFPITRIGAVTRRAPRVIGLHFMNPVPLKTVVEVICGERTSPETLAAARALLARLGKEGVLVKDTPGYVSNRVLMVMINEAALIVSEGVARAEDVDRILTGGAGHKMGPLATADLIGVDTVLDSLEALHHLTGDAKYRPCPLLREMVDAGRRGCKCGRGFFSYGEPST